MNLKCFICQVYKVENGRISKPLNCTNNTTGSYSICCATKNLHQQRLSHKIVKTPRLRSPFLKLPQASTV